MTFRRLFALTSAGLALTVRIDRMCKQYKKIGFSRVARLLFVCTAGLLCLGCDGPIVKRALPAPPRADVKVTLQGKIRRFWGGDNFEFSHGLNLHYVLLRGVDSPDPGESLYNESRVFASQLTRSKTVDVQVVGRDEMMREVADVIVFAGKSKGDFEGDPVNLGVELIRCGLARYNPEGFSDTDVNLMDTMTQAENEAKANEVGIWELNK